MRHRKAGRQFSRNTSHRRAMFRALAANLVAHESIETTDAKAKELRRVAERLITRAKRLGAVAYTPNDQLSDKDRARRFAAQQQVGQFLRRFATVQKNGDSEKVDLVEKVFVDLAKRFEKRPGGYTRIIKLGHRRGDHAPMSLIEFVERTAASQKPEKGAKGDKPAKAPKAKAAASDLDAKSLDELKELAAAAKLEGRSKMNKTQLVEALKAKG
ncbi:MAG: 50S ribosomal protein L17 [Polyangiaceae bacterium]|nr:50S ribosomal protein L17 [Polyangiaceae bacterium]MCL4752775.1 50S ribosomal protein L17 [Myxococcales bacterium]